MTNKNNTSKPPNPSRNTNGTNNSGGGGQGPPGKGPPANNMITFLFIKKPDFSGGNDTGLGSYSLTAVFGTVVADFPDATPGQFALTK